MGIERLGTSEDRAEWLERRKLYLGASEIFTFRGVGLPRWWGDSRADVYAEKLDGVAKVFDARTQVAINHGSFSERDIGLKFQDGINLKVELSDDQFQNSEFPGIAATLDGYIHVDRPYPGAINDVGPQFCQDPDVFPALRAELCELGGSGALELKRSVSKAWTSYVPEYYISQLQCQMHVCDLPWAVICADTIFKDGYRQYWDLRAFLVMRDPAWRGILQDLGGQFLEEKERRCG